MSFYRPLYSSSFFPRMSFAPMSSLLDDAFWGPSFSSLYWDETEPATTSSSNKQRRLQQGDSASSSGKSGSGTAVATRNDSDKQVSGRQRPGLSLFSPLLSGAGMPEMAVDVTSTAQAYNVHASVPGIDKRDISVTVEDGNVLRIQAERRSHRERRAPTTSTNANANQQKQLDANQQKQLDNKEHKPADEHKGGNAPPSAEAQGAESSAMQTDNEAGDDLQYHHVESYYGRVERRMQLPEDVDVNGLTAKHENGVLSITIPRIQDKRPQQRRIEVA